MILSFKDLIAENLTMDITTIILRQKIPEIHELE